MKPKSSANEHYQREKARRAKQTGPMTEVMAAARREYEALLEAQAKKGKGGRPKKKAAAKPKVEEEELDDVDQDDVDPEDVELDAEEDADEA